MQKQLMKLMVNNTYITVIYIFPVSSQLILNAIRAKSLDWFLLSIFASKIPLLGGGMALRLCRVLQSFIRFCQVLPGFVRFCQVMSGFVRVCQVLSGFVRFCRSYDITWDMTRQNLTKPDKTCQNPTKPVKTPYNLTKPSKTRQNLVKKYITFTAYPPTKYLPMNL